MRTLPNVGVAAPSLRTDLHARLQCRIIVHMAQHAYPRTQKRVQRMSFRNLLWGGALMSFGCMLGAGGGQLGVC